MVYAIGGHLEDSGAETKKKASTSARFSGAPPVRSGVFRSRLVDRTFEPQTSRSVKAKRLASFVMAYSEAYDRQTDVGMRLSDRCDRCG